MKRKVSYCLAYYFMSLLIISTSCKSIIEEDINDKKVVINAPKASVLENYNQLFWWEEVEGATKYQVQIARPNFESIQKLVLDTLVTGTKLSYTLGAYNYEWRIRAMNGNYQTPYNGSLFTITQADLNTQYVSLSTPTDGSYTKVRSVDLTWKPLDVEGIKYQVQVSDDNAFSNKLVNKEVVSSGTQVSIPGVETSYYWRVRAFKGTDTTLWSDNFRFIYDVTAPGKPTTPSPADNAEVTNALSGNITWAAVSESNVTYKVFLKIGSAEEKQFIVSTNKASYTGSPNDVVTWKVQAIDAAGNLGEVSATWKFTIKS